jgi:hypothetical protein
MKRVYCKTVVLATQYETAVDGAGSSAIDNDPPQWEMSIFDLFNKSHGCICLDGCHNRRDLFSSRSISLHMKVLKCPSPILPWLASQALQYLCINPCLMKLVNYSHLALWMAQRAWTPVGVLPPNIVYLQNRFVVNDSWHESVPEESPRNLFHTHDA